MDRGPPLWRLWSVALSLCGLKNAGGGERDDLPQFGDDGQILLPNRGSPWKLRPASPLHAKRRQQSGQEATTAQDTTTPRAPLCSIGRAGTFDGSFNVSGPVGSIFETLVRLEA